MSERVRIELPTTCDAEPSRDERDRRQFLFGVGASIVAISVRGILGVAQAQRAAYPRQRIGQISRLRRETPIVFRYPWDQENCTNVLLKLNVAAAEGVGPDRDIVAFNRLCTHMGRIMLTGDFNTEQGIGHCRRHWTTFDLTRHGMVISGHATQGLPQILLEAVEDDLFAVGVQSLIFGMNDNRVEPRG